MKILYFDFRQ